MDQFHSFFLKIHINPCLNMMLSNFKILIAKKTKLFIMFIDEFTKASSGKLYLNNYFLSMKNSLIIFWRLNMAGVCHITYI